MEKKIKIKKIIWTVLLIIGILPFAITLYGSIYDSIVGTHPGICIMCNVDDRSLIYGLEAFEYGIAWAIYLFWPIYIIALIVIILAIIRLVMLKKKSKR